MRVGIISMKACRRVGDGGQVFAGGGFPRQVATIGDLFDEAIVCVPCERVEDVSAVAGMTPIHGANLRIRALAPMAVGGLRRRLGWPRWLVTNLPVLVLVIRGSDVVHCPLPGDVPLLGLVLARLLRRRLFVRYCGSWPPEGSVTRRGIGRLMESWAGPGNLFLATGAGSERPSVRNPHIDWLFASTVPESRMAGARPRRCPSAGEEIRLVSCGRLEAGKGLEVLVAVMRELVGGGHRVGLDVVGDGGLRAALEARVVGAGLGGVVKFHGRVAPDEVWRVLERGDVFLFPSGREGFPKAVVEALACGLPVVATRMPVMEAVVGQRCGCLVEAGDVEGFARAVLELVGNAVRYEACSRSAIEVARGYSMERWRDELRARLELRFGPLRLGGGEPDERRGGIVLEPG